MSSCSVPWPFKDWFGNNFEDVCLEHDEVYLARKYRGHFFADLWDKTKADANAAWKIIKRKPIRGSLVVIIAATIGLPFTFIYWYTD